MGACKRRRRAGGGARATARSARHGLLNIGSLSGYAFARERGCRRNAYARRPFRACPPKARFGQRRLWRSRRACPFARTRPARAFPSFFRALAGSRRYAQPFVLPLRRLCPPRLPAACSPRRRGPLAFAAPRKGRRWRGDPCLRVCARWRNAQAMEEKGSVLGSGRLPCFAANAPCWEKLLFWI